MDNSGIEIWNLPDEVLAHIFSNLDTRNILTTVVDVCQRWRSIVELDMLFWNNIQLVIHCDQFLNRGYLDSLSSNFPDGSQNNKESSDVYIGEEDLRKVSKVRCIKLEGDPKVVLPVIRLMWIMGKLSKSCKDIVKLECSHCFAATSSVFLQFMNDRYSNLNEIQFGLTCVWRIPYEVLLKFSNLNTIISHDYRFTRSDLRQIADGCAQLNSLWILFSRAIKNDDIIDFLEKKKETLRELGVGFSITDSGLDKVKECLNLNVLFIGDARRISESGINCLTNLSNLKYISLHRAQFHPESLENWMSSSTVPSQLTLLDLTDYYFKEPMWIHPISKKYPVTFSNDVTKAVSRPRPTRSRVHWMYANVL